MKQGYKQIKELLETLTELCVFIKSKEIALIQSQFMYLFQDIHDAVTQINEGLFRFPYLNGNIVPELAKHCLKNGTQYQECLDELEEWVEFIYATIETRESLPTKLDKDFASLVDHVSYVEPENMMELVKQKFHHLLQEDPETGGIYQEYYSFYQDFWGRLNISEGNYDVIENRVTTLVEHIDDFKWLYERLSDYRSKMVLWGILENWLSFDFNLLLKIKEQAFGEYFDFDLLISTEKEVFVDIGAFTGDSAKDFIEAYDNYKKVICYEITPQSFEKMEKNLSEYENIDIRNKGVGSKKGTMYLSRFGSGGSSNQLKGEGEMPVEVITIDEDIKEPITFIKMDIEGAEQDALLGCTKHIKNEKPKLAICTYHNNEDIWKIPRMISEIRDDYKFYMRYNGKQYGPSEYVLIAL